MEKMLVSQYVLYGEYDPIWPGKLNILIGKKTRMERSEKIPDIVE